LVSRTAAPTTRHFDNWRNSEQNNAGALRGEMADEQWEGLAHAIVCPTQTRPTGAFKKTVDFWQRRCNALVTATELESSGKCAFLRSARRTAALGNDADRVVQAKIKSRFPSARLRAGSHRAFGPVRNDKG
jgi:hypothetical protein